VGIETHQQANKLDSEAGEKGDIESVIAGVSRGLIRRKRLGMGGLSIKGEDGGEKE